MSNIPRMVRYCIPSMKNERPNAPSSTCHGFRFRKKKPMGRNIRRFSRLCISISQSPSCESPTNGFRMAMRPTRWRQNRMMNSAMK